MALLSSGNADPLALLRRFLLLLCACVVPSARAEDDSIYYAKERTFKIPFDVDPADRRIVQVLLHVSEDQGQTYQQVASAGPLQRGFTFTAKRDGWYYFAVQTVDNEQKRHPATLDRVEPGLKVYVDTRPPDVLLSPGTPQRANEVAVDWDIQDTYLDLNTLRLDFRAQGDTNWKARGIPRVLKGQLSWDAGINGPVEVRLQVKDRAGNVGEKTIAVRPDGGRPMQRADDRSGTGFNQPVSNVRKVNSKRISLNCAIEDIGPSDVSVVEIWVRPEGSAWAKHSENKDKKGPFVVDLPEGEKRYGITLLAKSGVGLGDPPPQGNDAPQVWVEVDTSPPDVNGLNAVVGRGSETGRLTITWKASDKNLSRQPISLSYRKVEEGSPWVPVPSATNLDNTGRYVWQMANDVPYQFHIRIEAVDEAGNIGRAETTEAVKVDLALPKAKIIGIDAKP